MRNHAFPFRALRWLRSPLALLLLLAVAGALLFSPAPVAQAQTPSTDATLSGLALSHGTLRPDFADATTEYRAAVENGVAQITVTPTVTDAGATVSYLDGSDVVLADADTNAAGQQVDAAVGPTTFKVTVTAADAVTVKTYTVVVERDSADDYGWTPTRDLNGLNAAGNGYGWGIWSDGTTVWVLDASDYKIYAYTLANGARNSAKEFALHADNSQPKDIWSDGTTIWVADATNIKLYAYTLANGTRDSTKEFALHADNYTPRGIWSDGTTIWVVEYNSYKLYAYTLTNGTRDNDKEFDLDSQYNYSPTGVWSDGTTIWVAGTTDKLYAYALSDGARDSDKDFGTLTGTGGFFGPSTGSPLGIWSDGTTMWTVAFKSLEGIFVSKIFSFNMPPPASTDATLSALTLSAGTLMPVFAAGTTEYTAEVDNDVASVTVTATKNHADATDPVIKKGATEYADGTVPLDVGDNAITVEVTAEDGVSTQTYTVTVTRAAADAPKLETLSVANAADGAALTLTPVFAADTTDYSGSPAYAVSLVTLTATATSGTTVAFEDGAGAALTDADTATGFQAALVPGENVIKVKVTKSGASASYTVTLTRAKPQVSITAVTASPATEGAALVFRVSRAAAAADALVVTAGVSEDGAMVADALETSSTVTIAANQTSADLTVQTDADDEAWEEHSTVTASTQPGDLYVQVQPDMAQIEVRDDDFPGGFAFLGLNTTVAEDAGRLDFKVQVETNGDTQPHRSVTLTVASRSGTAASPGDFAPISETFTFRVSDFVQRANGRWRATISASTTIVDDAVHEPDEQFTLSLGATPNKPGALAVSGNLETVTILDDDDPMLLVSNVRQGPEENLSTTANAEYAQGFTTGSAEDGYTLASVGLYLPSAPGSATLTVSLRAADGDNPSTTALHTLTNPQTFVIGTNYFAAPADTVLAKDTTYFVVVSGSARFALGIVASDDEDSGGAAGWSIADRARAEQSGAWAEHSTDDNLAVSVRGEEFVSNDATLSALGLSAGTLKPPFAAGTTTYTADVENSVAGVTVTATKNHADATTVIKLGGVVDADGTVALAEGANVITVEVTAEDGVTTQTYTVTVTRAAAADSTGTAGSSITVVIEDIASGKKVTVSWTDGGTCATTSSYNVYLYSAGLDLTLAAGITVTPAEGTSSYSKAKDFTSFLMDEVSVWCGTPASGRLVAKVAGLNEGAAGTYTHNVPSSDTTAPAPTIALDADTTDFRLLISFGEAVTGFEESDILLSEHWSLKAGSLTADTHMTGRYTVVFEADRDIGGLKRDLTATIAAGAANDAASNPSLEGSLEVEELFAGPAVFVRYSPYITETYQACETPEDGGTEVCEERTREVYAPDADAGDFRVLITFLNSHIEGRPVTGFTIDDIEVSVDGTVDEYAASEMGNEIRQSFEKLRTQSPDADGVLQDRPETYGAHYRVTIHPAATCVSCTIVIGVPAGAATGTNLTENGVEIPNTARPNVGSQPLTVVRTGIVLSSAIHHVDAVTVRRDPSVNSYRVGILLSVPLANPDRALFTATNAELEQIGTGHGGLYEFWANPDTDGDVVISVDLSGPGGRDFTYTISGAKKYSPLESSRAAEGGEEEDAAEVEAEIPDDGLRAILERALGKEAGEAVTQEELAYLALLDLRGMDVADLTGLEHAVNLTDLYLDDFSLDLGPLKGLGVNIHVDGQPVRPAPASDDATLSGLELSGVTLAFDPAATGYAAEVANDVAETTVTPTTNHDGATYAIKLDGVGDDDGTVSLAVGENVVVIEVTAEDGNTVKTYTVTVTRAEPPAPGPSVTLALSPSGAVEPGTAITVTMSFGGLAFDSDKATRDYVFRADVKNSDNRDADGCEDRNNGYGLGVERYMWKVDEDPETRRGRVAAGCPAGDYTVRASIASPDNVELAWASASFSVVEPEPEPPPASTDAALSGLTLSGVTLAFDPATTAYTAEVANSVSETTVTATTNDDGATYVVKLGGVADEDGTVSLSVGENAISIEVTAEDGNTTHTYTVTVTRAAPALSTDSTLSSLVLSGVNIGAFDPATTRYTASVGNDVTETTVTPAVNHDGATYAVQLDGQVDADGTVPLSVGENVVAIVVTAEDGKTTRTYTVAVTRAAPQLSSDAALRSLALSGLTLAFDPATSGYTAQVANDVTETTVTPAVNHDGATYAVQLDGQVDADGTVPLSVGENVVAIVVTAEDGKTTHTYTVTVTRAAPTLSDDAALRSLALSGVTLAFDPATTGYTAQVANDVTETTVTPAVNHDGATYAVQLDGQVDADGTVPLSVGTNAISIVVTAEDGKTVKTYTVAVIRAAVPPATPDRPAGQLTGEGTVSLDWNDVPTAISYDVRFWQVDAHTELSADASVNGISIAFNGSGATVSGLPTDYEWYFFEVRAVNDAGASGWSPNNAIEVPKDEQIPAPDAPDQPDGRLTGEGAVSLDWNDVPTATSYIVTVWLDDGWTDLSADASVQGVSIAFNGSSATVSGLPTDYEWYYFVVRAVNAGGISDWSDYNAIQVQ